MPISNIRTGKRPMPPKVVIYGGIKLGKSTFAARVPGAIFIPTEEGLDAIDAHQFPRPESVTQILGYLGELATEDHDYKCVVIDSLDWTEPLIWEHVASEHGVDSIEAVGGGYGKGYTEAVKVWRRILAGLDYLRENKGMSVILIGHDEIRKMEPPDSEAYDYAALKLHKKAAGVVEEWADVIGYARIRQRLQKEDQGFGKERRIARTLNDGERVLFVGQHPAFVTGNRYGLPDEMPLSWESFREALSSVFADE